MQVNNFHKFKINSILEKDGESKSGIKYKENIGYIKSDTGKTSAISYKMAIGEALAAIDDMAGNISVKTPSVLRDVSDRKYSLADSLKPDLQSHLKMLKGLNSIASYLESKAPKSEANNKVVSSYNDGIKEIEDEQKSGKISKEIADGKKADLKKAAQKDLDEAKEVYYTQIQKALPYYKEAVFAFTQAASNEISNIDSEEAKVDDLKSEENYTDWLSSVTKFVESILYGTNK
jgi:hypothetical protein